MLSVFSCADEFRRNDLHVWFFSDLVVVWFWFPDFGSCEMMEEKTSLLRDLKHLRSTQGVIANLPLDSKLLAHHFSKLIQNSLRAWFPECFAGRFITSFCWKKVSVWNFGGKTLYVGILEDLFYLIWELYRIELGFAGFWGNRKFQRWGDEFQLKSGGFTGTKPVKLTLAFFGSSFISPKIEPCPGESREWGYLWGYY